MPSFSRLVAGFVLPAFLVVALASSPAADSDKKPAEVKGPLVPERSLKELRVTAGLRIELVAAEPDLESPVAIAFDEDGRLWVVEMRDYPSGPGKGKLPEGRIRILEDKDGSGRYKHSSFFADNLLFGNGLMPWRGGAIVTCAPHILYLQDTTGKGVADKREVLFEGFKAENPQLRVSHPILGLDGMVYVANGLRGGQVVRAGKADAKPVNLSGMDFRFDPRSERHEAIAGMGQYGNTFDDWGNRFVCTNRNPLTPIVLPRRYVERNPFLAVPDPARDNQNPGGALQVFPLSKNWTTSIHHAGSFTAACGVHIYRGNLLPLEFRGTAFTCEPTGNLVHQQIITPDGAGFQGKRAKAGVEFLATPDDWCRPVSATTGPDGALYVVDMYRAVIEHPDFMPPELKNRPDLLLGKDKGRIWRIVPEGMKDRPRPPRLSKAKTTELVEHLAHPDGWWRTTAQRLLLERSDKSAIELLRKRCQTFESPLGRLHAAYLLDSFQALDAETVLRLQNDPHPRLREHGLLLGERWLAKDAALQERALALAGDEDPRVRYQAALSLGEWDDDRIVAPLAKIALRGADDIWTRAAVASAVPKRAGALAGALCKGSLTEKITSSRLTLLQELAALVGGRRDPAEVAALLGTLASLSDNEKVRWQLAGLNGLADGMGRRGTQLAVFLETLPAGNKEAVAQATALLSQAAQVATDAKRDLPDRLTAIGLLAHAPWATAQPVLPGLVNDDPAQEVRVAAVRALAAHPRKEVAELFLKSWRSHTPAVRREVTEAMLRQPDRILALLKEIEAGRLKPGDLDAQRSRQLINHSRPEIKELATKLLKSNLPADRKQVLERYQAALKVKGDNARGKMVFQKHCATCHKVAGVGTDVGPDIGDLRTKTADAILVDVLDPNAAIDNNFINYTIVTRNGKVLTGLIAAETASSVTLKRAENQTEVVLRQDIEEIQSSGVSLMPDGMEKTITIEEMGDLLFFLKNWRYKDGEVPVGPDGPAR